MVFPNCSTCRTPTLFFSYDGTFTLKSRNSAELNRLFSLCLFERPDVLPFKDEGGIAWRYMEVGLL